MLQKSRNRLFLLFFILLGFVFLGLPPDSLAAGKGLDIHEETVYTVLPDEGQIQVHTVITVINRDPSTRKQARGGYYYYNRLFWAIPKGAAEIQAARGDGTKLSVRRKKGQREYDIYTIPFRRRLTYNQKIRIELDYLVTKARPPFYLSPNVVSLPLFQIDDGETWIASGQVTIHFPQGFEIDQFTDYCEVNSDEPTVHCESGVSSQPVGDFFVIEGIRSAEARELLSDPIPLQRQSVRVRVKYVTGEDAWAQKIVDVLAKALPELERIHGFPYQGSEEIEVVRSSASEIWGYEGMLLDEDTISIQPNASNATIVHEAAHLWSWPFEPIWLSEGWAEWSAREAIRRLKMDPESYPHRMPRRDTMKIPLQDWKHMGLATEDAADIEEYGYAKSYDTMQRLVKLVGLAKLQKANAFFAEKSEGEPLLRADSYSYFEWLLQRTPNKAKARQLRKLWRSRVLNKEGKALLSQRDAMWKEVDKLAARAKKVGWDTPQSLQDDMLYWHFQTARQHLEMARQVLDIWEETLPLLDALGWQPDDLTQRRFETSSRWDWTLKIAERRLKLARSAMSVQKKLQQDDSLDDATIKSARKWLDEAGKAFQAGNMHLAEMHVLQARRDVGLE